MPNNPNPQIVSRKIAVLGFRAVGKTSLTNAFVSGTFSDKYDPTIENTHPKTIRFRKVHFATDIIDTAGMVSFYCSLFCVQSHHMIWIFPSISFMALLVFNLTILVYKPVHHIHRMNTLPYRETPV